MAIAEDFLARFDRETRNTRVILLCLRDDVLAFKPHSKSMSLGRLACHLVEISELATSAAKLNSADVQPAFDSSVKASSSEVLEAFDKNVETAREAIAQLSDERMREEWTFLKSGTPIFSLSRKQVLEFMVVNHLVHHRAQLGVYLRLKGISIPGMYGPSADDQILMREFMGN